MKEIKAPPLTPEQLAYFKEVGKLGGYRKHKTLTLLDIPKGSKIVLKEGIVTFHHLDGMYSYCTADWLEEDNVVHIGAMTPLKKHTRKTGHFVPVDKSTRIETREV